MHGDSGLVPSSSGCPRPPVIRKTPRQQEASPPLHERSPRYAAGDDPTGDHPIADPSAALRRRRAPPRPTASRPARRPPGHVLRDLERLHRGHPPGRREAANPGSVLFLVYLARSVRDQPAPPLTGTIQRHGRTVHRTTFERVVRPRCVRLGIRHVVLSMQVCIQRGLHPTGRSDTRADALRRSGKA